jgi:hypothetical protein
MPRHANRGASIISPVKGKLNEPDSFRVTRRILSESNAAVKETLPARCQKRHDAWPKIDPMGLLGHIGVPRETSDYAGIAEQLWVGREEAFR